MDYSLMQNPGLILLILLWTLPWKGWALWKAARLNDKLWFIIILFVNTLGLLEILYIFFISKGKKKKKFGEKLIVYFRRLSKKLRLGE